jgi:16S rRNA processing protein RimM
MDCFDVLAGTIISPHGVQGAVKVRLATPTSRALISPGEGVNRRPVDVWLGSEPKTDDQAGGDGIMATITQLKDTTAEGRIVLAKLIGVVNRDAAQDLAGKGIYAPASRRAPLREGEYFADDLIGIAVVGDTGRDYGRIKAVLPEPGNDVYETDQGAIVPAVKAFVLQVDLQARVMTVRDVPGLFTDEAEEIAPGSEGAQAQDSVARDLADDGE